MHFYVISAAFLLGNILIHDSSCAKWNAKKILKVESYDKILSSVQSGDLLGITECKTQFQSDKWNCSTEFSSSNKKAGLPTVTLATAANKEIAFLQSIRAAGVTYALTRDCRKGHFKNCDCVQSNKNSGEDWSGCHDNVKFGDVLCRHFLDDMEKGASKKKVVINQHNNAVGRKAVKATLAQQCKCHGVSGSCSTQSCWKSLASFKEIGVYLKKKYQRAKKVRIHNSKLVQKITKQIFAPLTKKDRSLIFLRSSPDYCHADPVKGSTGVLGRVCISDSPDYLQCSQMCISCGYKIYKKLTLQSYRCNCKFVWCCDVKCDSCKRLTVVGTCQK